MNKSLLYKITFFVGGLLIVATGMLFILLADLELGIRSTWLFITILFSIGSAVCALLSDKLQDDKRKQIIIKSLGIALAVCFVVTLFIFMNQALASTVKADSDEFNRNLLALAQIIKDEDRSKLRVITIIPAVLGIIATLSQAANLTLTVVFKNEIDEG